MPSVAAMLFSPLRQEKQSPSCLPCVYAAHSPGSLWARPGPQQVRCCPAVPRGSTQPASPGSSEGRGACTAQVLPASPLRPCWAELGVARQMLHHHDPALSSQSLKIQLCQLQKKCHSKQWKSQLLKHDVTCQKDSGLDAHPHTRSYSVSPVCWPGGRGDCRLPNQHHPSTDRQKDTVTQRHQETWTHTQRHTDTKADTQKDTRLHADTHAHSHTHHLSLLNFSKMGQYYFTEGEPRTQIVKDQALQRNRAGICWPCLRTWNCARCLVKPYMIVFG